MKNTRRRHRNVSPSEQKEDERGPMPTYAIKNLLKKWADKNPEGFELAQNGRQHDRQVTKMVAQHDANLPLSSRFCQVPIESPF
ncbi:hypothetical protein TNCV_747831 [Trichonephila clavipes]|nr:hypothetical protein TNCV_747831 [Trichonephila clavipes]